MKLVQLKKGKDICLGIKTDKGIIDVAAEAKKRRVEAPTTMMEVISGGKKALSVLKKISVDATKYSKLHVAEAISNPGKVYAKTSVKTV